MMPSAKIVVLPMLPPESAESSPNTPCCVVELRNSGLIPGIGIWKPIR
jgi:hypothetical protein